MRGGEGDVADAVRYGKGNMEVEVKRLLMMMLKIEGVAGDALSNSEFTLVEHIIEVGMVLKKFSCSCRKWDLTDIPCHHAMGAICSQVLDPEDFLNLCYNVQTFKRVYQYAIMPVNDPKLWAQTGNILPIPPNIGRKTGRTSRVRRMERGKEKTISTLVLQSQEFISVGSQPPTQGIQSQELNVMEEQPSHKTLRIKKKLAKKQRQNRPIPYWIRMRTDNTIRQRCSDQVFKALSKYEAYLVWQNGSAVETNAWGKKY
ncbi:UNVERIFIED_CONTAM: 60S ribosomal protein L39-1 [Sesamum calycinum]|uniref:60S ribosomal protein L39-1 n=1 Tax=Sesamum calycinum TaxID=2727403 RepID=A0AAW2RS52_9LAMI